MKFIMLLLLSVLSTQAIAYDVPESGVPEVVTQDYRTAKGNVYQIHDNKAYKVIVVDGEYLTSNEWFPLGEVGFTKEYVQMVKKRQVRYMNDFISKNRGY